MTLPREARLGCREMSLFFAFQNDISASTSGAVLERLGSSTFPVRAFGHDHGASAILIPRNMKAHLCSQRTASLDFASE